MGHQLFNSSMPYMARSVYSENIFIVNLLGKAWSCVQGPHPNQWKKTEFRWPLRFPGYFDTKNMQIHKNWISNRVVATGCNRDILGINKACKGWHQIHRWVNIRATLHILKRWSQLGGRTILIQDEAGCEATSVPGVSCSDLWHDEIVGQNQIMNTNKDCGSEWLMVDGCCR